MQLYKLFSKIAIATALIALPITWLVTTNSGLNTILSVAKMFSPVKFSYRASKGQIIGQPIEIMDLTLNYQGESMKVADLRLDWRAKTFTANNIRGFAKFLPKSELLADQHLVLDQISGNLLPEQQYHTWALHLSGKSTNAKVTGELHARYTAHAWNLQYVDLEIGKNIIVLKQQALDSYTWDLAILEPQVIFAHSSGTLHAKGVIQNLQSAPIIKASVSSKNFRLDDYQVKNLHGNITVSDDILAPLEINVTATNITIAKHNIHNFKLTTAGSRVKHTIQATAIYNGNACSLRSNAILKNNIWSSDALTLNINQQQFHGKASYNLNKPNAKLELQSSVANYLKANLELLNNNNLNGDVQIVADDIAFLMQWMPDVTRLKGKFKANAIIGGTTNNPFIMANAHLTEVTATLPRYGVKIKPFELHLEGDKQGKFIISGKGNMRRGSGSFTINGYIAPFKDCMPNAINIIGDKVEFINNSTAHLIASNKVQLNYIPQENRLDITGDIEIHEGHITMQNNNSQTVKSKDVVFTGQKSRQDHDLLNINPNINLRIVEGVKFTGFDLYADISGKLNITRRNNILYANGRITIKEGTYQLPGQELLIHKGRILYPPGTSLANPVLDIKMHGKSSTQESIKGSNHDVELSVQGTAHKPVISESGLTGNQDRAISRALLTGTSLLGGNLIQDKLKTTEIGVVSNADPNVTFFNPPTKGNSLRNKELVVGHSLGKRLHLQYLRSISEANQKVRLKYALNRIWSIGVESGTQGGGADLSFSVER